MDKVKNDRIEIGKARLMKSAIRFAEDSSVDEFKALSDAALDYTRDVIETTGFALTPAEDLTAEPMHLLDGAPRLVPGGFKGRSACGVEVSKATTRAGDVTCRPCRATGAWDRKAGG